MGITSVRMFVRGQETAFGLRDWARAMVIGVANIGGKIVDSWLPHLLGALEAGLDVVSGMHARPSARTARSGRSTQR